MIGSVPWWAWAVTAVALTVIVVIDLVVIARRQREVTTADATRWVLVYVSLAAVFACGLLVVAGSRVAGEFVGGYVTEYSLSVDNLFVFLVIMTRFKVPPLAKDKALYIGIVLSLVLRALFIAAGAAAIAAYSWVFYVFGAFLIYTAVKLLVGSGEGVEADAEYVVVRFLRTRLRMTPMFLGNRFTVRIAGRRFFTPMVLVVATIAIANVIFALDSIPAIF